MNPIGIILLLFVIIIFICIILSSSSISIYLFSLRKKPMPLFREAVYLIDGGPAYSTGWNFDEAVSKCQEYNGQIANTSDFQKAYNAGNWSYCSYGWATDSITSNPLPIVYVDPNNCPYCPCGYNIRPNFSESDKFSALCKGEIPSIAAISEYI